MKIKEFDPASAERAWQVPRSPPTRCTTKSSPGSTPLREILVLDEADRTSGRVKEKAVPALLGWSGGKWRKAGAGGESSSARLD